MPFDFSSAPKLWFKRVVIFESLHPRVLLRDIKLHRGLNIIVGKSSHDPVLATNPMAMAGHSVGKTTFCRLLRYCLGEQHFSTGSGVRRLQLSLPHSWVGAELEIEGSSWAVLRPLGPQKASSFASQEATIEELAASMDKGSGFFEFCQELDKLLPSTVHHPELTYKWGHLLSWLSRDQECRLRKFEAWRDSDSDSEAPGFRKPKEYPIHLVRGMLDLVVPEESQWSQTLSELTKKHANLQEQQQIFIQEADYFYDIAYKKLASFIGDFPDTRKESAPRLDGPIMCAEEQQKKLQVQYAELEKQFDEADANFRAKQRDVDNAIERKKQIDAFLNAATPKMHHPTPLKPINDHNEKKKELVELGIKIDSGAECRLTHLCLTECTHLATYIEDLKKAKPILSLPAYRQEQALQKMDDQRREKIQAVINQQKEAEATLRENEIRAEYYKAERNRILKELFALENKLDRLEHALKDFKYAEKNCLVGKQNTEVQKIKEGLEQVDYKIHQAKEQLDFFRDQSAKKDTALQALFNTVVQRVLRADYSGSLTTTADGFAPHIKQGNTITGAAVESLSFVLLDITSMLAASNGIGEHPGFLIHDSPREADLDLAPYHSLFTELAAITEETGGGKNAPFQYIVTTTTEPPSNLEGLVRLYLAAYPTDKMLFKRQLKDAPLLGGNLPSEE